MSGCLAIMPVKNEANRYLKDVLAHLIGVVGLENIFVYDDQSTDGTFEIISDFGICVARRGDDVSSFIQHEGRFRQWGWECFEEAMRPEPGDWVLAIDADEMFYGFERLPVLTRQEHVAVLGVTFYHMWNETHFRVDKAWRPNRSSRLFRYYQGGTFADRQLACGSEPSYVLEMIRSGRVHWDTGLAMKHLGYMRDRDKREKHARYMAIDSGNFHSRCHIESIMDESPTLAPWTLS